MNKKLGLAIGLLFVLSPGIVKAQERIQTLAVSGNWAAAAYRRSLMAPPEVCIVTSVRPKVVLRAQDDSFEFRVIDDNWSLPTQIDGAINVKVGGLNFDLLVTGNTEKMIIADLSQEQIVSFLDAMDRSQTFSVTIGKERSRLVSLNGSSRATNAFRTCASLRGGVQSEGQNPFR